MLVILSEILYATTKRSFCTLPTLIFTPTATCFALFCDFASSLSNVCEKRKILRCPKLKHSWLRSERKRQGSYTHVTTGEHRCRRLLTRLKVCGELCGNLCISHQRPLHPASARTFRAAVRVQSKVVNMASLQTVHLSESCPPVPFPALLTGSQCKFFRNTSIFAPENKVHNEEARSLQGGLRDTFVLPTPSIRCWGFRLACPRGRFFSR